MYQTNTVKYQIAMRCLGRFIDWLGRIRDNWAGYNS